MRFRLLVVALTAAVALPASAPAEALGANVYVMTGSGTISPGLGLVPIPQSVSFTGTAGYVSTFPVGLAGYPCSFSGAEFGSMAGGVGTLAGSCGPASYTNILYVRAGATLSGIGVVVGGSSSSTHFDCVFQPTDVNPTTRYSLVCVVDAGFTVP